MYKFLKTLAGFEPGIFTWNSFAAQRAKEILVCGRSGRLLEGRFYESDSAETYRQHF
jgi:hypothetical protein